MFKNLILVAIRNLKRQQLYSFINILGLSVGLICTILILLWVNDEVTYDKFIPKHKKLYQAYIKAEFDGTINTFNSLPLPTYKEMKNSHSNIKESCVTGWGGDRLLTVDDIRVIQHGYFVSNEFLEMFEFQLKQGDKTTALDEPKSIVISESLAKILFKDEDPMGKFVRVNDENSLQVTAILEDVPGNSTFQFDYLLPWTYYESISPWVVENTTNWGNFSFQVFIELYDENKVEESNVAIADMVSKHGEDEGIPNWLFLHPMDKWHLYSNFENGENQGGLIDYVKFFSAFALLILFVACINFMNLSTARSEKRAREVGIRKSLGSSRKQLIYQFLSESILISLFSFIVATIVAMAILPWYNTLVDKELFIDLSSPKFWWFAGSVIFVTGIIAGSYPAFYLSSFNPVKTLKGTFKAGKNSSLPRKVLVVLQFGFAILTIISMIVINQQIQLVQSRDLGYDQENLILVDYTDEIEKNYDVLKQELLSSGDVESVNRSNGRITTVNSNNFIDWPGKPEALKVMFVTVATGYDYAKTHGVEVLHGRDFSKEFPADSDAIIINKAAMELMKLDDPIGTPLTLWEEKRKLIGVVDNALMGSPFDPIRPLFMILDPEWTSNVSVRIKPTKDLQASLQNVETIFQKYNSAYPFEYKFADVEFDRKFTTINLTKKLASIFSLLALIITGLGLFGLASFTAQQRIKEIGIRKVLGASNFRLVRLLSKDFSILVIIGFIVASPLAWYLLDQYLDRYTIRVDIYWWIFPLAGLASLFFALLVVSNQAWRAATTNPSETLRNE